MTDVWDTIAKQAGPPPAAAPTATAPTADVWDSIAKQAGAPAPTGYVGQILHGLGRGLAAIPGIPGDVANLETQALGLYQPKAAETLRQFMPPTSQSLVDFAQRNLIGDKPAATSPGADFAGRVASYVPSALLGGPEGLAGRALLSGASGAASEGAKDIGLPPLAQMAAGLVPGLAASGASLIRSPARVAVEPAARYTTPQQWAQGAAMQQSGQEVGVPLMAHEALAPNVGGGPLSQLAGDVRATPQGNAIISQVFEQRPGQITAAAKRATATLGPDTPAPQALQAVRAVAQQAIDDAKAARTKATFNDFQRAGEIHVSEDVARPVIDAIDGAVAANGADSDLGGRLLKLRKQITTPTGDPETLTSKLQRGYMELRDSLKLPAAAGGAQSSSVGVLSDINGQLQDALIGANPQYATATLKHIAESGPVVALEGTRDNPGFVRRLAEAGSNAELQKLLLDPENVSPATVRDIGNLFAQQGRMSDLGGWMRHYLESSLNKASTDLQTGMNPALGVNWRKMVYGNPAQRDILSAYFDQLDPTGGAGRGFDKLMTVLERTGKTPGIGSATAGRLQTAQAMETSTVPTAAGIGAAAGLGAAGIPVAGGIMIGNKTLGYIQRAAREMGSADIAKALTAPDAVQRLQALARRDPASMPAMRSALAILSGHNANDSKQ